MLIDEVFQLVNFIADKNGRGYVAPGQFNVVAKVCQLEFLSSRLGNPKQQTERGALQFGSKSTRRLSVDIRPFIYGPEAIQIRPNGTFNYPSGYMWPDSWSKMDYSEIIQIEEDEYPGIKKSSLIPPTEEYPVMILRNPYGYIDPYSIGSFLFSYVKYPADPVWGYDVINEDPVFNESKSTDFTLREISMMDITALILEKIGVFLDKEQITQYSIAKQTQGT